MTSKTNMIWIAAMPSILLAGMAIMALAGSVAIPHTFTAGSTANADHVNENFTACETAINDNDARIAALEAAASIPRIVRGNISADGFVVGGTGFTLSKSDDGNSNTYYDITYSTAFLSQPVLQFTGMDTAFPAVPNQILPIPGGTWAQGFRLNVQNPFPPPPVTVSFGFLAVSAD